MPTYLKEFTVYCPTRPNKDHFMRAKILRKKNRKCEKVTNCPFTPDLH